MIYSMNTKTFIKIFSNEDPKRIEKTQFVVVSKRIRKTIEEGNVIFCSKLFPSDMLLADYRTGTEEGYFEKEYKKFLRKNRLTLAIIIKGVIEEKYTVVLLSTLNEWKVGYMQILSDFILEEFGYPVIDYKKFKVKKQYPKALANFNERVVLDRCNEIISEEETAKRKNLMKTRSGRAELVKNMSTEEMKKQLKKMNLYSSGLDRHTMRELLEEFFIN